MISIKDLSPSFCFSACLTSPFHFCVCVLYFFFSVHLGFCLIFSVSFPFLVVLFMDIWHFNYYSKQHKKQRLTPEWRIRRDAGHELGKQTVLFSSVRFGLPLAANGKKTRSEMGAKHLQTV